MLLFRALYVNSTDLIKTLFQEDCVGHCSFSEVYLIHTTFRKLIILLPLCVGLSLLLLTSLVYFSSPFGTHGRVVG
jgi:hypothetical protein